MPRLITENIRGNLSDPKHRAIALRREANRIGAKLDLLLHGHDAPGPGETLARWLGLAESKRVRHNSKRRVPRSKTWQYLAQLYIDEYKDSTIAREINEVDAVRRFALIRDLDFCQDRFPPDIKAEEWDEYFDDLMRDRPTSSGGKTTSLVLDGLHKRGFQVTEQTYLLCREDELCVERVLIAYVKRNGGYLPQLSERNGATSRTQRRDQLVASNPDIQSNLNPREKRRKWVQDLKQWVADVAPKICSHAHAREVFAKKIDEWFVDPMMSEMFCAHELKGRRVTWWISELQPDFCESGLRKKLEFLLSEPVCDTIEELGLKEARRNWKAAKRMLAKAICEINPSWI